MLIPTRPHGAYLRAELLAAIGRVPLRVAIKEGRLLSFSRDVLVDSGRSTDFVTRAAASLLYAGSEAALSGQTALAHHGCSAADRAPIHVSVPYQRKVRSRAGLLVHQTRVDGIEAEERDGLRVVKLELALADFLCRGSRRTAIACADQALAALPEAQREGFRALIGRRLDGLADQRGCRQGWFLLDLARGLSESPAESWTLLSLVEGGLPLPVQQFSILGVDGNEIYRLDFAWPELRVGLEYDGYAAHEGRRDRDEARDADLGRRGWIIIRSDAADLKDPARLIADVRAAFRRRGLAA